MNSLTYHSWNTNSRMRTRIPKLGIWKPMQNIQIFRHLPMFWQLFVGTFLFVNVSNRTLQSLRKHKIPFSKSCDLWRLETSHRIRHHWSHDPRATLLSSFFIEAAACKAAPGWTRGHPKNLQQTYGFVWRWCTGLQICRCFFLKGNLGPTSRSSSSVESKLRAKGRNFLWGWFLLARF